MVAVLAGAPLTGTLVFSVALDLCAIIGLRRDERRFAAGVPAWAQPDWSGQKTVLLTFFGALAGFPLAHGGLALLFQAGVAPPHWLATLPQPLIRFIIEHYAALGRQGEGLRLAAHVAFNLAVITADWRGCNGVLRHFGRVADVLRPPIFEFVWEAD